MGWKAFKEHYKIERIVQSEGKKILIGSPYIQDLIVIWSDGEIIRRYDGDDTTLLRYQAEIEADQNLAKSLIEQPDTFGDLITVYTFDNGEIIEKQCEVLGWPNCTTDGQLMYKNTFFTNRDEVVEWGMRSLANRIKGLIETSEELKVQLRNVDLKIGESMAKLDELKREIKES